ncbi:MAG: DUF1232 domain-containing protein [Anaerovibrio sp.]|uniref:YkvA family protein n=1 Tax=Anaerovibrio sp. TaxID=1872532 RepID=UPI0025E2FB44|nr:YkvA family protein [Anaerovibrio sp.]MCR5175443.1 DUF1232 domain-containing protein [Anaerovibrio sp.]
MADQINVNEEDLKEFRATEEEKKYDINEDTINEYTEEYSEEGLWEKIKKHASKIGLELVYKALQLFYVAQSPHCPKKVKMGIYGALGYLIAPIDFIPDIMPGIGYTDDAAAIALALVLAQAYINDEIRQKAKAKIADIFGEKYARKIK